MAMHPPLRSHSLPSGPSPMMHAGSIAGKQDPDSAVIDGLASGLSHLDLRQVSPGGQENNPAMWLNPANSFNPGGPFKAPGGFYYPMTDSSYLLPSHLHPSGYRAYDAFAHWNPGLYANYHNGPPPAQRLKTSHGPSWLSQPVPAVPELVEPRRTSWSSRDETSPQTPTFGMAHSYAQYGNARSPASYSTPSPMSSSQGYYPHIWKNGDGEVSVVDFWELMNRDPPVPEAIPAPRSGPDGGRGTLDKILDNRDGTTNVYVRGLRPETTDDMLLAYGARFGPVVSCKSIVELKTSECKGFGFIKFHNYIDAENCIRGFYHRGYEAKFARKSHNSRLKDLASPENTNLYVSNLPKTVTEAGLKELFETRFPQNSHPRYQAGSCKILKDSCGISRGVGFARFETPRICEEIMETFNNQDIEIGKDVTTLQIRYADTEDQKKLKQFTAIKRQFKADEYNEVVHGIPFDPYASNPAFFQSPLASRMRDINAPWLDQSPVSVNTPSMSSYPFSVLRNKHNTAGPNSHSQTGNDPGLAGDHAALQRINENITPEKRSLDPKEAQARRMADALQHDDENIEPPK